MNREAWLNRLTRALRPKFKAAGYPIPEQLALSCGWPSAGGVAAKNRNEAEYWGAAASPDGTGQVFISPILHNSAEVAAVVVHELLHATLDNPVTGPTHDKAFRQAMPAVGLRGKPTDTHASRELKAELRAIVERLGPYPHAGLKP